MFERLNICGGKMVRPALVLLSGKACDRITDEHLHIAAVLEIIHNATLLHDDVIDEGQKRRGAPTVNSLFGNESAVLLGDFLLSRVIRMCAGLEPNIAKIIAATAVRTCEGELRQTVQKHNWQLSESEYIEIITEKTAALFSSCCLVGGLLAESDEVKSRALAEFGLNFGIAFQITDDLLDITGNETETGKTVGRDVLKNKLTLPVIHLLQALDNKERAKVVKNLSAGADESYFAEMNSLLRTFGSLDYARKRAKEFVAKAVDSLARLKESDAKSALVKTASFIGERVG
jgi:octaprenyl-diphosphate synthase